MATILAQEHTTTGKLVTLEEADLLRSSSTEVDRISLNSTDNLVEVQQITTTILKLPKLLSSIFQGKNTSEIVDEGVKTKVELTLEKSISPDDSGCFSPASAKLIKNHKPVLKVLTDAYCISRPAVVHSPLSASLLGVPNHGKKGRQTSTGFCAPQDESSATHSLATLARSLSAPPEVRNEDNRKHSRHVSFNDSLIPTLDAASPASDLRTAPWSWPLRRGSTVDTKIPALPGRRDAVTNWSSTHHTRASTTSRSVRLSDVPSQIRLALSDVLPIDLNDFNLVLMNAKIREYVTTPCKDAITNTREYLDFMKLVELDLPEHILCRDCKCFHRPLRTQGSLSRNVAAIKSFYPRHPKHYFIRKRGECLSDFIIGRTNHTLPFLPHIITFSQLQLAMKRHKLGLDSPLTLSPLNSHRIFQRACWKHLWSSKSKILGNRLVVRTQHWYFIDPSIRDPKKTFHDILHTTRGTEQEDFIVLCRHNSDLYPFAMNFFAEEPRSCWRNGTRLLQLASETAILHCDKCPTSYKIDLDVNKNMGSDKVMVVTAWRDFGRCENPYDLCFVSHFKEFEPDRQVLCRYPPDHDHVFFQDGREEISMPKSRSKLVEEFEGVHESWHGNWIREMQGNGLWSEMQKFQRFGSGERRWHEMDEVVRNQKKAAQRL